METHRLEIELEARGRPRSLVIDDQLRWLQQVAWLMFTLAREEGDIPGTAYERGADYRNATEANAARSWP